MKKAPIAKPVKAVKVNKLPTLKSPPPALPILAAKMRERTEQLRRDKAAKTLATVKAKPAEPTLFDKPMEYVTDQSPVDMMRDASKMIGTLAAMVGPMVDPIKEYALKHGSSLSVDEIDIAGHISALTKILAPIYKLLVDKSETAVKAGEVITGRAYEVVRTDKEGRKSVGWKDVAVEQAGIVAKLRKQDFNPKLFVESISQAAPSGVQTHIAFNRRGTTEATPVAKKSTISA